ncbi:MAG: uncharacterized protein A8A55_2425 [Amphiamblys sp. WSBS2006]|nr:MAG: uncharacterized protein A8A55_2425 [Amphiamblys sp. WSBS2006]
METGMTEPLKLGNTFFVFTEKGLFLAPEREYNRIHQLRVKEYTFLKSKYLPEIANRDTERVACIVCQREPSPEESVSPLCRGVHYVICKKCIKRDKTAVDCPHCKEKEDDNKAFQKEILDAMFYFMPHQTLPSLELRPDIEVETVTRLPRETKVILNNVSLSDVLFFKLLSRTVVEITNSISLFRHNSRCLGVFDLTPNRQIRICFDWGCEEMKQAYSNIKTIPRKSIKINTEKIHAAEDGVYFLLKAWDLFDGGDPHFFLESSKRENIGERLHRHEFHEENEAEEAGLSADETGETTGMQRMEKNNAPMWKVKVLRLTGYGLGTLPRLRFRGENEMEKLELWAYKPEEISEILEEENCSIRLGKARKVSIGGHAIRILPKLKIHEESVMGKFSLNATEAGHISEILKEGRNSIWIGRVKTLGIHAYAVEILPKLRLHEENVMEELDLDADKAEQITEVLKEENNSIWVGTVGKVKIVGDAVGILPKLRIHGENVMEEFYLNAYFHEHIYEILEAKDKSVWIGRVRKISLEGYAEEIKNKLDFTEITQDERLAVVE